MKKIVIIFFISLSFVACSENKNNQLVKLLENCADDLTYNYFYENVFMLDERDKNEKDMDWEITFRPVVINYIKNDLEHKLRQPLIYKAKTYRNDGSVNYDQQFSRCESNAKKYPIKFKAKWENYSLD